MCLTIPRKGTHRDLFNLAVVTLGEGGPRTEILFDHHGPKADQPPHPAPLFPLPADCWDGPDHLIYSAAVGTETRMVRLDLKTGKSELLDGAAKGATPDPRTNAGRRALLRQFTPSGDRFLRDRQFASTRGLPGRVATAGKSKGCSPCRRNRSPGPLTSSCSTRTGAHTVVRRAAIT